MSSGEPTRAALVTAAADRLRAAGEAAPRETALQLLAGHRGESVAGLLLKGSDDATAAEQVWLDAAVARLLQGEPIAYLVGHAGFRHLELLTDARALIPRPETESVVGEALSRVTTGVAADVGTGTGAIALALRQEGRFDRVIGIDLSPDALALAAANGARTGLAVEWRLGDLVGPLRDADERVDLLVSNPPYLTDAEYGSLDRSVRDFEPMLALVSGPDGMLATARLLDEARAVMRPGGWLIVEVDCRRAGAAADLATRLGWEDAQVRDDLFGRARTLMARWGTAG